MRRALYKAARLLGDHHAIETGRYPQRVVRRMVYRHTSKLARFITKLIGVAR